MDRSPVETISVCVTSVTARGSGSPSRLPLESVGLSSDGGKGAVAGDTGGSTVFIRGRGKIRLRYFE